VKTILTAWLIAAGVQTPAPAPLSASVREHLRADTLTPIARVADLPALVQSAIKTSFSSPKLEMADPGQEFQSTDVVMNPSLPTRRLISAGCSSDHCLVHYEQGGIAHFYRVLLVSVSKTTAKVEWNGMSGGPTPNIAELQAQIVSGKIKG
jgi:hypothetical protein